MRHADFTSHEGRGHRTREQTRCQIEAKPNPSRTLQRLVFAAGPRQGRSCGKFGTRAPLFPHWHVRDLGDLDYGPPVTADMRQGSCVLLRRPVVTFFDLTFLISWSGILAMANGRQLSRPPLRPQVA